MASIHATLPLGLGVADLAAFSRTALDRPLHHAAELLVAVPCDEGLVLGSYQHASELRGASVRNLIHHRRGSGGAEARVGPGTVWLQLALAHGAALVPCPPSRLINRYVRPLLRAITKLGVVAHYFERDWLSGAMRPVGALSFAHDVSTGRASFEAMVAVTTSFAIRARPSNRGKEPATLEALGMRASPAAVAEAVAAAYEGAYGTAMGGPSGVEPENRAAGEHDRDPLLDRDEGPPWAAVAEEGIGLVGAGPDSRGRLRVGGELMVSRDALARLEDGLAALSPAAPAESVGALVDATLGAPGVALFGIGSLRSIRDVVLEARARHGGET